MPYELVFTVSPEDASQYTFDQPSFDPLLYFVDGGAIPDFTLQVHGEILYVGGETYSFTSDDDLWVFINGHLAVDLGGLHSATSMSVNLDEVANSLQLKAGDRFPLDLFYANREPPDAVLSITIPATDLWGCPSAR
jgi:fibro-slime domain-containing protein